MNVVSCTVDDQRGCPNFTDDASEVGKQISAKIWLDQGTPPLGAEDQMQQNIAGCMRQASFAPARGFSLRCYPPTACAVGCILAPLSRLSHHHADEGEQAVTTVTSIVADLLWSDVPSVENPWLVNMVAKVLAGHIPRPRCCEDWTQNEKRTP